MKIAAGQAVTITAQSSNPIDPPGTLKWIPQAGDTTLTLTITNADGDSEVHPFHVRAVAPKGA